MTQTPTTQTPTTQTPTNNNDGGGVIKVGGGED